MAYNKANGPRKGRKKVCVFCVEKVEEIRNGALRGSDIESISFTEDTALKTIGAYAFENSKIKSISLPESVTTINNNT